ncbi:DUF1525 domain-containing protein [Vibrio tubiashii]|uniref:DUF1525 domain-containing protein n=1 Tax=Vibrio tubiashii TaxID=29498 RepID=UPI001EFC48B5|nr:DUF1525 domain-containing protein [Vibrio tubiashii]MCG9576701.1 DUF1525 domain-containing protein [Vibrio tubiashii]
MMKLLKTLVAVSVAISSLPVFAHSIKMDVYIPTGVEVYAPMGRKLNAFNVHYVDGLKKQEEKVSQLLPKDPKAAEERLTSFIQSGEYKEYAQGLVDGWHTVNAVVNSGIKKVPAVVIDDHFVAYGVSPLEALKYYDAYIVKYGIKK